MLNRSLLGEREFSVLRDLIYQEAGIHLSDSKRIMMEARLQRRLVDLNLPGFKQYVEYLHSPKGWESERVHFVNRMTTNKTDFFREPKHFEFLTKTALPRLEHKLRPNSNQPVMIWSSASSTGEEAYTIGMVISEYIRLNPTLTDHYHILGTDISTRALGEAREAIYPASRIEDIPPALRSRYLLSSKDPGKQTIRICPMIRQKVEFESFNLVTGQLGPLKKFDIIFCRNVLIYFDLKTRHIVLKNLYRNLLPGGYLFIGHSETLHDIDLPYVNVQPTIYTKKGDNE